MKKLSLVYMNLAEIKVVYALWHLLEKIVSKLLNAIVVC